MSTDPEARDDAAPARTSSAPYVVVARRYRPQTFDELIGQGHVAKALKQAIATGRVGHAYLFTGARGVGKTSAARILAKALNCVDGPTPTPCNRCEVCLSVARGDDVDVIEIDGASNRGIDEIRQLRQNVAVRPSRVRFKIYIIDEVHMLTKEAFNALLKTLEEPPEHVKFIFATTEPNKIPITILSRCQRFDFAGIESASIQERLRQIAESEGVEIEPEALQILAMRAAGSMRDSQSLLEQLLAIAGKRISASEVNSLLGIAPAQRISDLARALVERDSVRALAELDEALAGGADEGQLVDQLLGYFRDVMALSVGCEPTQALYLLPAQVETAAEVAERLGVETVLAILQILDQTAARMRVSVHGRTLAEMAVVRISALANLDDLATLAAELRGVTPQPGGQTPTPRTQPTAASAPKKNGDATSPVGLESRGASLSDQLAQRLGKPDPKSGVGAHSARSTPAVTPSPKAPPSQTAPPPQIAAGTPSFDNTQATQWWRSTVEQVSGLLAGAAGQATTVEAVEGRMVVRFDQQVNKDLCDQPQQRSELEAALAACSGRKLQIEFAVDAAAAASAAPARRRSRRELQAELTQQPFVQKAMELFEVEPDRLRYSPPESEG